MTKPSKEVVNKAMENLFKVSDIDRLYTSLHNVLLDQYGKIVEDQSGSTSMANELFNVRCILEALGEMKGIAFNGK